MSARVLRHEIPVDDEWHDLELPGLTGSVLHVASRRWDVVEVWTLHHDGPTMEHRFRVFGTGQPLPDDIAYIGTAIVVPDGSLVWHLFEQVPATVHRPEYAFRMKGNFA